MTREEKEKAVTEAKHIMEFCPKEARSRIVLLVDNYADNLAAGFSSHGDDIKTDDFLQFISVAVHLTVHRLATAMPSREALSLVTAAAESGYERFIDDTHDEA